MPISAFGYWGTSSWSGPVSLVTSETSKTLDLFPPRQLPGDRRSLRLCQQSPRLDGGEIPLASGHGVHTAGVAVVYGHPLHEWIHFKGWLGDLLRLFVCTLKRCYITRLNERFNGSVLPDQLIYMGGAAALMENKCKRKGSWTTDEGFNCNTFSWSLRPTFSLSVIRAFDLFDFYISVDDCLTFSPSPQLLRALSI